MLLGSNFPITKLPDYSICSALLVILSAVGANTTTQSKVPLIQVVTMPPQGVLSKNCEFTKCSGGSLSQPMAGPRPLLDAAQSARVDRDIIAPIQSTKLP